MTDFLDQAASAFDSAIGNSSHRPDKERDSDASEVMFGNLGVSEDDVSAGGDTGTSPEESFDGVADPSFNPFSADDVEAGDDAPQTDEDEEGEESDSESDDDDSLLSREFTVMVDGQEVNVPLREALDGYIRTKTFHQRMNQLDQERKQVVQYAENIVADRSRVDQMLADAEELIKGVLPAEPDWDKLFAEDPRAARDLQVKYNQFSSKIAEIQNRRVASAREQAERQAREQAEFARAELPKFYQSAGFKSKEEAQRGIEGMRRTALNSGFSEQEIAGVLDSRMLGILLKAAKYDAIVSNKPKAVKSGKTPVKPGTVSHSGPVRRGIQGAVKNHARSGSIESAADVFAKMLK